MTQADVETFLKDETKHIEGDLRWSSHTNNVNYRKFRACIEYRDQSKDLILCGAYCMSKEAIHFAIIYKGVSIYRLDVGSNHRHKNSGEYVGELHKHKLRDNDKEDDTYIPDDITSAFPNVLEIWQQFCKECKLRHNGRLIDETQRPLL